MPSSLRYIADIHYMPALITLTFPEGFEEIDSLNADNLKNLNLPSTMKSMRMLDHCHELETLSFPEGMEYLPGMDSLTKLKTINIPSSALGFNEEVYFAIKNCPMLETIIISDESPFLSYDEGFLMDGNRTILYHYVGDTVGSPADIESISLNKKTAEIPAGNTLKLTAVCSPDNAVDKTIVWKSSNTDVASVDKNGNVTGVSRGTATITATSKANSKIKASCKVTVLFKDATHENVTSGMFNAIYWVADKKITGEKVKFGTMDSMTRGQFVRFLYRYAGNPSVTSSMIKKYGSQFKDVDKNYTHFKAIVWAVSKGLIAGYSDGTFKPNGTLTRNNVATILWKYAGSPKVSNPNNPFSDVAKSKAIAWGKNKKIFTGTKFQPKANCLRGDFAVFLYRYDVTK